ERVVISDLLVVDHPAERQTVEGADVLGGLRVGGVAADQPGDRLDLGDLVARQEARAGARIGDRLVLLVEALRGPQRPPRGKPEEGVRVALQRGEVVEELRPLALLLLLEARDLAGLVAALLDDSRGELLRDPLAAEVSPAVGALPVRLELRLTEPVRLWHERADLLLAPRDQRRR